MSVVKFKIDVTNENQVISKEHGLLIKAGTEIKFDKVPRNVERLIKLGVAEKAAAAKKDQDPPQDPPKDPDGDDVITQLKAQADELGIEYAANIGAKTLQDRIEKHLEEQKEKDPAK